MKIGGLAGGRRGGTGWDALVVALVTLTAFAPALSNGFVNWDDQANVVENFQFRGLGWRQLSWMFTTFHMGHYTPVTWMTLGLDYLIWGMTRPAITSRTSCCMRPTPRSSISWRAACSPGRCRARRDPHAREARPSPHSSSASTRFEWNPWPG